MQALGGLSARLCHTGQGNMICLSTDNVGNGQVQGKAAGLKV